MKKTIFVLLLFSLTGCASYFLRKNCESINWFEHGKKVALSGAWLESDQTLKECRKAEADIDETQLDLGFKNGKEKYCNPTNAYQVGKIGDFFSRDFCEGPQISLLLNEHKKGVRDYCAKSNGQEAGSSGKKYQNICPKDLEPAFLPEYKKGRKKYVQSMIVNLQGDLQDIDGKLFKRKNELAFLQGKLSRLNSELSMLQGQATLASPQDPLRQQILQNRIHNLQSEQTHLSSQVRAQESEVNDLSATQKRKQNELEDFRAELPGLD